MIRKSIRKFDIEHKIKSPRNSHKTHHSKLSHFGGKRNKDEKGVIVQGVNARIGSTIET